MSVFISHSFEDRHHYENVRDALELGNVPYWDVDLMKPGAPLADRLRTAIDDCALCVFIATKHSVQSQWCSAELGAFWGARKTVLIYLADGKLPDNMPKQYQGHFGVETQKKLVEAAREELKQSVLQSSQQDVLGSIRYHIKFHKDDAPDGVVSMGNYWMPDDLDQTAYYQKQFDGRPQKTPEPPKTALVSYWGDSDAYIRVQNVKFDEAVRLWVRANDQWWVSDEVQSTVRHLRFRPSTLGPTDL